MKKRTTQKRWWSQELHKIKNHPDYLKLNQRKFTRIKGFTSVSDALAAIAILLQAGKMSPLNRIAADAGYTIGLRNFGELLNNASTFPVFAVDESLTEALWRSRPPRNLEDLPRSMPFGLLLLPQKMIQTPDGDWLEWLVFRHVLPGDKFPAIHSREGKSPEYLVENPMLTWASQPSLICWGSSQKLTFNETGWVREDNQFCYDDMLSPEEKHEKEDSDFSRSVSEFLINLILFYQMRPDDVSEDKSSFTVCSGQGFGLGVKDAERQILLRPRLIGGDYGKKHPRRSRTQSLSSRQAMQRRSPQAHWRCGHFRRVPVGAGRKERKTTWIEPHLVSLNSATKPVNREEQK